MGLRLVSSAVCLLTLTGLGCGGPAEDIPESAMAEMSTATSEQAICATGRDTLANSYSSRLLSVNTPAGRVKGTTLFRGQCLWTCQGRYQFCMQTDGNLVLYRDRTPLWASNTNGTGATKAIMQDDGNFVVYAPDRAVWASNTNRSGGEGHYVIVQGDGNVVMYNAFTHQAIWATGTNGR